MLTYLLCVQTYHKVSLLLNHLNLVVGTVRRNLEAVFKVFSAMLMQHFLFTVREEGEI